jgi:uncharacterized protein YdeI (YjbR/CyaY-like superfamily)
MEIGTSLYVKDRRLWRAWLAKHHKTAPLCYGWIDSITKPVDEDRGVQRFSPRRPSSRL